MIEIGMIVTLFAMGIYFVKSTDLPKELQDRSAQYKTQGDQTRQTNSFKNINITIAKETLKNASFELHELNMQKKIKDIQLLNLEIDKLTVEITTLEQELRANDAKNLEIQNTINAKLVDLQSLHVLVSSLA